MSRIKSSYRKSLIRICMGTKGSFLKRWIKTVYSISMWPRVTSRENWETYRLRRSLSLLKIFISRKTTMKIFRLGIKSTERLSNHSWGTWRKTHLIWGRLIPKITLDNNKMSWYYPLSKTCLVEARTLVQW